MLSNLEKNAQKTVKPTAQKVIQKPWVFISTVIKAPGNSSNNKGTPNNVKRI